MNSARKPRRPVNAECEPCILFGLNRPSVYFDDSGQIATQTIEMTPQSINAHIVELARRNK